MSGGSIVDAYGERKAKQVREDTWGHLRPEAGLPYKGSIVITVSQYSEIGAVMVRTEFENDADSSPWFFEDAINWLSEMEDDAVFEQGKVYIWRGTYTHVGGPGDNEYKFDGKLTEVSTDPS